MIRTCLIALLTSVMILSCTQEPSSVTAFGRTGTIENRALDEISGIQASLRYPEVYFVHNDDGEPRLSAIDAQGRDLGSVLIEGSSNRDWEDMTAVPSPGGPLLVIADMGDNFAQWSEIILYFIEEPDPRDDGLYDGTVDLLHRIRLRYPDGARDCESLAYDPVSERLLFLTKRDTPPRIYAIGLSDALAQEQAELEYVGEAHRFRPPTAGDMRVFGPRDGRWVSQPTGMDINHDGSLAAVISYRSLYFFDRAPGEDWADALNRQPLEFQAPPSRKEEAVTFLVNGRFVLVTTEGIPAPVYRLETPLEDP